MAALSSRFCSRSRSSVATLALVALVVLQAFALAPARAHAGPGLAPVADYCGGGQDAPAPPSAPCATACLFCAAAAAQDAPPRTVAISTPPMRGLAPAAPPRLRMRRPPPGWASSWSSQAPPALC